MTRTDMILAVDGGGTRCRVACQLGASRHQVETGSANVSSDLQGAVDQVLQGLEALAVKADLPMALLTQAPAYLGLAGVTGPRLAQAVLDRLPLSRAQVADDRAQAVRGALGRTDGAVVHCGTGSFLAIQKDAHIRLVGGWGSILGDEASAHWLGKRVLSLALDAQDGIVAGTSLTEDVLRRFDGAAGIVAFAATATPADIAALAPKVTSAAAQGDDIARFIQAEAATGIAERLTAIGWQPGLPIALTGGVASHYARDLPAPMQAAVRPAKASPIDGALSLARDLAQGEVV